VTFIYLKKLPTSFALKISGEILPIWAKYPKLAVLRLNKGRNLLKSEEMRPNFFRANLSADLLGSPEKISTVYENFFMQKVTRLVCL
jgi:hypothetical protein